MTSLTERIKHLGGRFYPDMVRVRHQIHAHPELGLQEHQTSRLIAECLATLGVEVRTGVAGTGVVGLIRGQGPGRTVLLRADMDALPIQEEADVPFRSQVPNRMHACGHDGHVAGLLGAAMILNQLKDLFPGNVKLVFQPAEETVGGAQPMIEAGVLADPAVDAAFAAHLWGPLQEGWVQVNSGRVLASANRFSFRIRGVGGHGAMPHLAVDPITLAAQAITFFQTIVSRRIDPLEPVVLTIGSVRGGEAGNVIPDSVEASGTMRTFSPKVQDEVPREMERILKGVTEAQGAAYDFDYQKIYPPVCNDGAMARLAADAFAKVVGDGQVERSGPPTMASEDFGFFSRAVPSAFVLFGIAKDPAHPVLHHNGLFQWDDANLGPLSQGMAQVAVDFLGRS